MYAVCGRFTLASQNALIAEIFAGIAIPPDLTARYNIAPSQDVAVIPNDGGAKMTFFQWGLIPSWAKDPKIGNRMINARGETVAEKPSFRTPLRRRRCLVPADGFYEWQKDAGKKTKTPIYIQLKSGRPFAFAGLWDQWKTPEEEWLRTFTIITTDANTALEKIHDRMPVILPPASYEQWLDPSEQSAETLTPLLKPFPSDEMITHPVSKLVNSPANDVPECVQPTGDQASLF